jgi:threonyl-tRNA synthetase
VLAQAVQQLRPDAKLGIGPPITDGFYYDFDVAEPFTPTTWQKLESAMKKIIRRVTLLAGAFDSPRRRRRSSPTSRTSWS